MTFSVGYAEAASKIAGYEQTTANLNLREKATVNTGGIQDMIKRQTCFKLYDAKNGRIRTAYRHAGGKHMDIEPATAADTMVLCEIYGVSSAKEIADQNRGIPMPVRCMVFRMARTRSVAITWTDRSVYTSPTARRTAAKRWMATTRKRLNIPGRNPRVIIVNIDE